MKYRRFEELPVWKAGIDLAAKTYDLTAKPGFRREPIDIPRFLNRQNNQ